jgi:hypothetical protein
MAHIIRETRALALEKMRGRIQDSRARLRDVVKPFDSLDTAARLDEGRAPSHSINVNTDANPLTVYERAEMVRYTEALLAKLDSGDAAAIDEVETAVVGIVDAARRIVALVKSGQATTVAAAAILVEGLSDVG